MQELVGRLTALDPEATESLKVIAYFDALVDGHANAEVLLRGAAVLSGCPAGFVSDGVVRRVDGRGARSLVTEAPTPGAWPEHTVAGVARAWIERDGMPHANDAMILERLAIGLAITLERSAPAVAAHRSVDTIIDSSEPLDRRIAAAVRLRLDPLAPVRVIAQPAAASVTDRRHNTVVVTPFGPIRAIVSDPRLATDAPRAGLGTVGPAGALDVSWRSALLALRLTSDRDPVLDADELGGVLLLAEAADAREAPHPDLVSLRSAIDGERRALAVLEAIVSTDSLRAAAADAGIHHSTMQARATDLSDRLGYDIRTPAGRTRLSLAVSLHRLAGNRFD